MTTRRTGINLHIVRNAVSFDSRVLKETGTLLDLDAFDAVEIAGFHEEGYAEQEDLGGRAVWRARLRTRGLAKHLASQAIKYFEWRHLLLTRYRHARIAVIHCHDLEPLPIAVRLKQLTGARLVYDAHELETEREGAHGVRQWLNRMTERRMMRHVDRLITVSPSILTWYQQHFPGVQAHLVRNVPHKPSHAVSIHPLRQELDIPHDSLLLLFLGRFTAGRGIETVLEAVQHENVHHHVLFMGGGPLEGRIRHAAQACSRIHLLPPVPTAQVLSYAAGADVGLCLYEDTCLNHRYCLPNKLFESLLAARPVLASELPDQAEIVRRYRAGWTVAPAVTALTDWLTTISRAEQQEVAQGLAERIADLTWESEADALKNVYAGLVGS